MARDRIKLLRRRIAMVLEQGPVGDPLGVAIDRLLIGLIVINLIAVALESMPRFGRYEVAFDVIEYLSLVVFTLEYALRL
jgi:voltage-gated potassium channel